MKNGIDRGFLVAVTKVSVVIPTLSVDQQLIRLIGDLKCYPFEIVVVCAQELPAQEAHEILQGVKLLESPPSRGGQIANGVAHAQSKLVWILHKDTTHIDSAAEYLLKLEQDPAWGRFNVTIPKVALVGSLMNMRSRLTKICTGDQGIFVSKTLLADIGGFPNQMLMEDIELSKRLKKAVPQYFQAPSQTITTDGQRWVSKGWLYTVLNMWFLRGLYFLGASPQWLYKKYYDNTKVC